MSYLYSASETTRPVGLSESEVVLDLLLPRGVQIPTLMSVEIINDAEWRAEWRDCRAGAARPGTRARDLERAERVTAGVRICVDRDLGEATGEGLEDAEPCERVDRVLLKRGDVAAAENRVGRSLLVPARRALGRPVVGKDVATLTSAGPVVAAGAGNWVRTRAAPVWGGIRRMVAT